MIVSRGRWGKAGRESKQEIPGGAANGFNRESLSSLLRPERHPSYDNPAGAPSRGIVEPVGCQTPQFRVESRPGGGSHQCPDGSDDRQR